jgi:tetratricopeptide (TPR) repeat protein
VFSEGAGQFWQVLDTRPYMRARLGVAMSLIELGRAADAISHLRDIVRLNPDDNQGARYPLLVQLLLLGHDDQAAALVAGYPEDPAAEWTYARPLIAFRGGRTAEAVRDLDAAREGNPLVPECLLDSGDDNEAPPNQFALGSLDEALAYAEDWLEVWDRTPDALAWLKQCEQDALQRQRRAGRRRTARRSARGKPRRGR